MEGRLEYTMLPDGTITGKLCRMCRWKNYIIELPDKEPDGSISNNLASGSTALTRVKRIASEGRL
jgi:hypothetical protein